MKRKMCIFKNVVMLFMAIGLVTAFVSCTNKDNDEIGPLRQEVQSLRATLTKEFDAKVNAKADEFKAQLDAAKAKIAALGERGEGMSPEQVQAKIDEATSELITAAAAQAMYDEYVESVKAQLEGAVTEAQLNALKQDIEGKIADNSKALGDLSSEVNGKIVTINQKIASLETMVGDSKGAFQQGLDNLKSEITAELDKLKAENPKLRNEISEVERKASEALTMKVNELNEKIEAQKTELVKMLGEYKKANKELIEANGKLIKTNADDIQGLKDRVQTLEGSLATANTNFTKFVKKTLPNLFSTILNSRLTSLTFLPEYVSWSNGALPVVMFSPLVTPCDENIDPVVELKYMVSPSTVKASDIDQDGLVFKYNDPKVLYGKGKTQAEKVAPEAEFVSLENGVLTVRAKLNVKETWNVKGSDRIDQLMLQVPSKKEEGKQSFVVNSDWVKVIASDIRNYGLGKNVRGENSYFPTTLGSAKSNDPVVELAYDESLDLNDFVKTIYGSKGVINNKNYGLSYEFNLNDENGDAIVYEQGINKTDQQKFIKLNGSVVTTRVYDLDGKNPASIDRTPIVHVILKSNKCDELNKEAYIKINIVRSKADDVKPVEITPSKNVEASCGDYKLTVGTQEMNEKFYAKAGLSKIDFHNRYTLQDDPQDTEGVGTVTEKYDFNNGERSYNLVWNVTSAEIWNALGTGREAVNEKEISKVVEYRSGNNVIKVTFRATVKRPLLDLSKIKLDSYWSPNKKYVRFNITVPDKGSKDFNKANIKVDIDNIFNNENKNGDIVIKGWKEDYDYTYTFVEKQQLTGVPYMENKVINLSGDTNVLYAEVYNTETKTVESKEKVAEISDNNIVEYQMNDVAEFLLNKSPDFVEAELQMNVEDHCGHSIEANISNGNKFMVHFLRPINVDEKASKHFVDGVDFGAKGSVLNVTDIVVLSDWRKNITGRLKDFSFETHKNYYDYYKVSSIKIDEANIKVKGINGGAIEDKPASIEVKQDGPYNSSQYKYGKVTYRNNNSTLNSKFTLVIPVTVTYKYGEVKTTVYVDVKPTKDASRKRVK